MTEIKASDGKLYVSAIFDCYDLAVLGLAMDTNMKATLCEQTLDNACKAYPMLRGAILHSDRGTQYTSELYRKAINKYGILQSMNSAGGRCHAQSALQSYSHHWWLEFRLADSGEGEPVCGAFEVYLCHIAFGRWIILCVLSSVHSRQSVDAQVVFLPALAGGNSRCGGTCAAH